MKNNTPVTLKKVTKPRIKKQPSIIDKLPPYDISYDILNSPAKMTIGQMLQYPI